MNIKRLSICFFIMIFPDLSHAMTPSQNYACLARSSTNVFSGKVTSISSSKVMSDYLSGLYVVNITVTNEFKGDVHSEGAKSTKFSLLWRKDLAEVPRFEVGKTFAFFTKDTENGPVLINGTQSAAVVKNDIVYLGSKKLSFVQFKSFVVDANRGKVKCD